MVGISKYLILMDGINEVYETADSFRDAIKCVNGLEEDYEIHASIYMKVYSDGKVEQDGKK